MEKLESRALLSASVVPLFPTTDDEAHLIYDHTRDFLYVLGRDGNLGRYDVATGTALGYWRVGATPVSADMTQDGKSLYVTDSASLGGGGVIHRVDLADGTVTDLHYALDPFEQAGGRIVVTAGGEALFRTGFENHTPIRRLDLATGEVTRLKSPVAPYGELSLYRASLSRSADGGTVFISTDEGRDGVAMFYDPVTDRLNTAVEDLGPVSHVLSPDGSLVAMWGSIRDRDLEVVCELPIGQNVLAFDPVRPRLYTVDTEYLRISAFDTSSGEKLGEFPIDASERYSFGGVVLSDDGSRMYITSGPRGQWAVREYPLGDAPRIVAPPRRVAAGAPQAFTVSVRDAVTGEVRSDFAGTISLRSDDPAAVLPAPVVFTPADGGTRAVSVTLNTPGSRSLTVVDDATGLADTAFDVVVDGQRPTATVATNSTVQNEAPFTFAVQYTDDAGIDFATVGDVGEVAVVTPDGAEMPVRFTPPSLPQAWEPPRKTAWVTYTVDPPGGRWDYGDNGRYTIFVRDGAAADDVGNTVSGTAPFEFVAQVPKDAKPDDWVPPPPPELAVSLIANVPARAIGGDRVRATAVVKNVGTEPIIGPVSVGVGLMAEAGDDHHDITFVDQEVNLKPGRSKRVKLAVELPPGAPDGTYRISVSAEAPFNPDAGREQNTGDNVARSAPFRLTERRVELLTYARAKPVALLGPRATAQVTFRVRNEGNATGGGTYDLSVFAIRTDDDGLSAWPGGGGGGAGPPRFGGRDGLSLRLKPGQEKTLTFNVSLLNFNPGHYYLWLDADNWNYDDDPIYQGPDDTGA